MGVTNIVEQLQRDEGYKQFPYRDTKGILTIGYGFNLEATGLSKTESAEVLRLRALNVATALSSQLPWTDRLDPVRRAVLVNQAYNMGLEKLKLFHTYLALVQAGKWDAAADDDLHTLWASEVGDRAKRLALQLRSGEWQ